MFPIYIEKKKKKSNKAQMKRPGYRFKKKKKKRKGNPAQGRANWISYVLWMEWILFVIAKIQTLFSLQPTYSVIPFLQNNQIWHHVPGFTTRRLFCPAFTQAFESKSHVRIDRNLVCIIWLKNRGTRDNWGNTAEQGSSVQLTQLFKKP